MTKSFRRILFFVFIFTMLLVPTLSSYALDLQNEVVGKDKVWNVMFNKEISFDNMIKEGISILDSKGNKVNTELKLGKGKKSILIYPPQEGYSIGENYTLKVNQKIYSIDGKKLKEGATLKYTIGQPINFIEDISVAIKQGDSYVLPKLIQITMEDNSKKYVKVEWNTSKVDTNKPGVYTFEGTVNGYNNKVKLILTVGQRKLSTKEIVNKNRKAVVYIETYDKNHMPLSSGSGFIVESGGIVVTNFHVIDNCYYATVIMEDGKKYQVENVLNYNKAQDIAILKLKDSQNLSKVLLGDSNKAEITDDVIAIGSPEGYNNTVSIGIISGLNRTDIRGYKDIQTTASITYGSSGGALFNTEGEVIGITYAGYDSSGNLGFAIPINEIKPFLKNFKPKTLKEVNGFSYLQSPSELKAWPISEGQIRIQWNPVDNVDGYYLYYSYDKSSWDYWENEYGGKEILSWYEGYSAVLVDMPSGGTIYFKVSSVKDGLESNCSSIVETSTYSKYFPLMSTAPQPYNIAYDYYSVNDSGNIVFYYYSIENLPESFVEDYIHLLEEHGWEYYTTSSLSNGFNIIWYKKEEELVSIEIVKNDIVISGSIH